jgi:hypothetical protein
MLFSMNTEQIIFAIDLEISKLQQARALLMGATGKAHKGPGRPKKNANVHVAPAIKKSSRKPLSTEAKASIAAAQKKRWAAAKKTAAK